MKTRVTFKAKKSRQKNKKVYTNAGGTNRATYVGIK